MLQRTSEIIRLLVKYLVFENQEQEKQVVDKLVSMGFGAGEIEVAFDWLSELVEPVTSSEEMEASPLSERVLIEEELSRFRPSARAALVRMQANGLLSAAQADRVIEMLRLEGKTGVGLGKLRQVISRVVEDGATIVALDRRDGGLPIH